MGGLPTPHSILSWVTFSHNLDARVIRSTYGMQPPEKFTLTRPSSGKMSLILHFWKHIPSSSCYHSSLASR